MARPRHQDTQRGANELESPPRSAGRQPISRFPIIHPAGKEGIRALSAQRHVTNSVHSATLADVLERILDKGLVIAGDIKIKLVDIELLTIQIRLVVASVDKAKSIGIDWWEHDPFISSSSRNRARLEAEKEEAT